jgi:hypothetical protein
MNKEQKKIFDRILEDHQIKGENIQFIQHRNLNEFKYFQIERINPTHRIKLYGILKNNNKKKDVTKRLIDAGEIIIGMVTITANMQILTQYSDLLFLIFSMYILNCFLFYYFGRFKIWGVKKITSILYPLYSWLLDYQANTTF